MGWGGLRPGWGGRRGFLSGGEERGCFIRFVGWECLVGIVIGRVVWEEACFGRGFRGA